MACKINDENAIRYSQQIKEILKGKEMTLSEMSKAMGVSLERMYSMIYMATHHIKIYQSDDNRYGVLD